MRHIKDGGPAFPTVDENREADHGTYGMSLRDYFAAKAMQAIISSESAMRMSNIAIDNGSRRDTWVAEAAYCFSDAMLAAREGKE